MKNRLKKVYDDDDGRVIAPMNVEGMPWYVPKPARITPSEKTQVMPELSFREKVAFMSGVIKAVLLVALVFIGGLLAFILFCTEIWFR